MSRTMEMNALDLTPTGLENTKLPEWVIKVVATNDFLEPEDHDVPGCYLVKASDAEAALDHFHERVAIISLEDFDICTTPRDEFHEGRGLVELT